MFFQFSSSSQRRFSHRKFALLLLVITNLNFPDESTIFRQYFDKDLAYCGECFRHQRKHCYKLFQTIEYGGQNSALNAILNTFAIKRKRIVKELQFKYDKNTKIIGKYFLKCEQLQKFKTKPSIELIKKLFNEPERLDGFQYCPENTLQKFVNFLQKQQSNKEYNEQTIWLHVLNNVQPILLSYLWSQDFPVPKTYASCGFALFQEYRGRSLIYYYEANFITKVRIAKLVLEAALKFSYGFEGYRLYITDLSADNIVYHEKLDQVFLVDLDTIIIVNSAATLRQTTHKHEYIDCDGCFAFQTNIICQYRLSDVNLYSACQLLRDDIQSNDKRGLLMPIPSQIKRTHPYLETMLDMCVNCQAPNCENRFAATLELIKIFQNILDYH